MPQTMRQLKPFTQFESIAFRLAAGARRPGAAARRIAANVFDPAKWDLVPLSDDLKEFEAVPKERRQTRSDRSIAVAWERVYDLRADPRVQWAEPLFEHSFGDQLAAELDHDPRTKDNYEWSLDEMCVKQAWQLFKHGDPGAGITVGHPDTGFTEHFEILNPRLRPDEGYNFEEDNDDPLDTLADRFGRNPGHGTRTASVIMSGPGPDAPLIPGAPFVSGTAPAVMLVPIRTTKTATIWNPRHLIKAIRYATTDQPCDVISISLGGPFSPKALHNAVKAAEGAGIIVLCGAGNVMGPIRGVAYPAAFDEVIAVAASQAGKVEWDGSCRGPEVDVTAPGASVWCAYTTKEKKTITFDVDRDSGTSFATAGVAGIAALWLSFHGRTKLMQKYGAAGIPAVLKSLLQSSCCVPDGWHTDTFGPGIADARRLLEMPLPPAAPFFLRQNGRKPESIDDNVLEKLVNLAYPAPRSGVALTMANVLRVAEPMLPAALNRVGDEIVFGVGRDIALRASLQAAAYDVTETLYGRGTRRPPDEWADDIRGRLSGPAASRQLRQALATRDGRTPRPPALR